MSHGGVATRDRQFAVLNTADTPPKAEAPERIKLRKLASGFEAVAGAAGDGHGGLYFVDRITQRICRWSKDAGLDIASDRPLDPVNLAQNKGQTVSELVDAIRTQVGYEGEIVYNTKFQDGSPKKVMDDSYFRQRFPDFSFTPLEAGIARTVEYYQGIL